jgi:hypothetical protein
MRISVRVGVWLLPDKLIWLTIVISALVAVEDFPVNRLVISSNISARVVVMLLPDETITVWGVTSERVTVADFNINSLVEGLGNNNNKLI